MDIVAIIASKSGLSPDLVQKGLGVILTGLKKFAPDLHAKVAGYIPNANDMESAFSLAQEGEASGGMLGSIAGMASKLFGGQTGETAEFMQMFSKAGFSLEQAKQFAPNAIEQLKAVVPADIVDEVTERIPGLKDVL